MRAHWLWAAGSEPSLGGQLTLLSLLLRNTGSKRVLLLESGFCFLRQIFRFKNKHLVLSSPT